MIIFDILFCASSSKVKSMEVGLTVGLKNQQGTLELSLLECGCHVKDLSIKLDGGVSWLYQGYAIRVHNLILTRKTILSLYLALVIKLE